MYRTVFVGTLLLGALLTFVMDYETPMLQCLQVRYRGQQSFMVEGENYPTEVRGSTVYTMQPGDILVGLQEYGLWSPYPLIYAEEREIEPFELLAGPYITNNVYSTGGAEEVEARYISDFYDTVSLNLHPYTYSDLVINPKTLDRLAGYRKLPQVRQLDLTRGVNISTYGYNCGGGRSKEYVALADRAGETQLTYRSYRLDTTLTLPISYATYLDKLEPALRAVERATGGCTTTLFYDISASNGIVSLKDGSCSPSSLEAVLDDLRIQVKQRVWGR